MKYDITEKESTMQNLYRMAQMPLGKIYGDDTHTTSNNFC